MDGSQAESGTSSDQRSRDHELRASSMTMTDNKSWRNGTTCGEYRGTNHYGEAICVDKRYRLFTSIRIRVGAERCMYIRSIR